MKISSEGGVQGQQAEYNKAPRSTTGQGHRGGQEILIYRFGLHLHLYLVRSHPVSWLISELQCNPGSPDKIRAIKTYL